MLTVMIFPTLSLGLPTWALLGYTLDSRPADGADKVYSLAAQGALSAKLIVLKPMRYRTSSIMLFAIRP